MVHIQSCHSSCPYFQVTFLIETYNLYVTENPLRLKIGKENHTLGQYKAKHSMPMIFRFKSYFYFNQPLFNVLEDCAQIGSATKNSAHCYIFQ